MTLKLAAHLTLANNNLVPEGLSEESKSFLETLDITRSLLDSPHRVKGLEFFSLSKEDLERLKQQRKDWRAASTAYLDSNLFIDFGDPLWLSEVFEYLPRPGKNKQQAKEEKADWLTRTQFFTPTWVAEQLAKRALQSGEEIALDPACGGGHLLIAALTRLVQLQTEKRKCSSIESLDEILGRQLYGADIDETMLALSRFSLFIFLGRHYPSKTSLLNKLNLRLLPSPIGSLDQASWPPAFFDAVIMNPPYQSSRTMDGALSLHLKEHYPRAKNDLYAGFLEMALNLLKEGGRLSTICQKSFFSIARYKALRLHLIEKASFEYVDALGPGIFDTCPGEKVNTAIISLQKRQQISRANLERANESFIYRENDKEKTVAFASLLKTSQAITGFPYIFSMADGAASFFERHPSLGELEAEGRVFLTNGLFTCNNKLFIKDKEELEKLVLLGEEEAADYVPYDKGGGRKWFHDTRLRLKWQGNGDLIRRYRKERGQSESLPGESHYFQPGLTYSYIGTSGFRARLLSQDAVFDISSSAIFCKDKAIDLLALLAFLNSSLSIYLLGKLNPTINFQIGDLRRLPIKLPDQVSSDELRKLAHSCIELVKEQTRIRQKSFLDQGEDKSQPASKCDQNRLPQQDDERALIEMERQHQLRIDELIFDLYEVAQKNRAEYSQDNWVLSSRTWKL
ncbi:MAG: N-6 DNA methylase [Candidatus Obscuribacterales bacterium]|nr:N-6 DNA methylase [Candidatus Obscuribacterales bacterium]